MKELEACPWGCKPERTTRTVPGPEPTFPDRERPVIFCKHARMEGEKRLVIGSDDWAALAAAWNTRPTRQAAIEEAARVAERDVDWTGFAARRIDEQWEMGPDGARDYRVGIAAGRAIAAAIRALHSGGDERG